MSIDTVEFVYNARLGSSATGMPLAPLHVSHSPVPPALKSPLHHQNDTLTDHNQLSYTTFKFENTDIMFCLWTLYTVVQ